MRNRDLQFLLRVGLALCMGMMLLLSTRAQSPDNLASHTYDTVLAGNGYNTYNVRLPQWSPDSGKLAAVKISVNVSSQYGFFLNNSNNNNTYSLTLGQQDSIMGTGLSSPYTNATSQFIKNYSLNTGEVDTVSPFAFLTNHLSSDSLTGNLSAFIGTGQVSYTYQAFTYTTLNASNSPVYGFAANINNSTHFSVEYFYTAPTPPAPPAPAPAPAPALPPATLTRFSAELALPHVAELNWSTVNDSTDRSYDIQRSTDGHTFTTINTIKVDNDGQSADYNYTDNLPDSLSGNIYYRLQIHDQTASSLSGIQQITVPGARTPITVGTSGAPASGFRIYPNPATSYIDINMGTTPGDWQVDILATNGTVVQRTVILQQNVLHIPFTMRLAFGTYFVKISDRQGQNIHSGSFVVIGN